MVCDTNFCYADYRSAESGILIFRFQEIRDGSVGIDTEDAVCEDISIHGIAGHAVTKDNHVTIYWEEDGLLLIVYLREGTMDTAIKCAESVRPIR